MPKFPQAPTPGVFDESLYTIDEVCAALSIGKTKAWSLIGAGALEAVRLGSKRCTRVKRSSIERVLQHGVSC